MAKGPEPGQPEVAYEPFASEEEVLAFLDAAADELFAEIDAAEARAGVGHPLDDPKGERPLPTGEQQDLPARLDALRKQTGRLPGPTILDDLRADRARDDDA